jgi:hypothetical protein
MLRDGSHIFRQITESKMRKTARMRGKHGCGKRYNLHARHGNNRNGGGQRASAKTRYIMNRKNFFLHNLYKILSLAKRNPKDSL